MLYTCARCDPNIPDPDVNYCIRCDTISILARLIVGITGESVKDCEWYEGIGQDAIGEARRLLCDIEKEKEAHLT